MMPTSFDLDTLVKDLRTAAIQTSAHLVIKTLLEQAIEDPDALVKAMPEFKDNDVNLYEDETVSIWHCRFIPGQTIPAHDHQMFAIIGVYQGAERNYFYEADP